MSNPWHDGMSRLGARIFRFALALLVCLPGGLCLCPEADASVPAMSGGSTCCGGAPESTAAEGFARAAERPQHNGCCGLGGVCLMDVNTAESDTAAAVPALDRSLDSSAPALASAIERAADLGRAVTAAPHTIPSPAPNHIALGVIIR